MGQRDFLSCIAAICPNIRTARLVLHMDSDEYVENIVQLFRLPEVHNYGVLSSSGGCGSPFAARGVGEIQDNERVCISPLHYAVMAQVGHVFIMVKIIFWFCRSRAKSRNPNR